MTTYNYQLSGVRRRDGPDFPRCGKRLWRNGGAAGVVGRRGEQARASAVQAKGQDDGAYFADEFDRDVPGMGKMVFGAHFAERAAGNLPDSIPAAALSQKIIVGADAVVWGGAGEVASGGTGASAADTQVLYGGAGLKPDSPAGGDEAFGKFCFEAEGDGWDEVFIEAAQFQKSRAQDGAIAGHYVGEPSRLVAGEVNIQILRQVHGSARARWTVRCRLYDLPHDGPGFGVCGVCAAVIGDKVRAWNDVVVEE